MSTRGSSYFSTMSHLPRWGLKKIFWISLSLIIIILLISPPGRVAVRAGLLTTEIIPDLPLKPLKIFTKAPIIEEVEITRGSTNLLADIYRPNDKKRHPAVVLTLGAGPDRETPLLVKLAESLARTGLVVLAPDIPRLVAGHVITSATEDAINVFEYLYEQPFVDQEKVGFGGFCVGASVAIVAAEDPRIAKKVAFVNAISPYFNLVELSREIITRQYIKEGEMVDWEPADLSKEALKKGVVLYFSSEEDRKILDQAIFAKRLPSSDILSGLSEESKKVLTYMQTQDFEKSRQLYEKNWPEQGKQIDAELSPNTNISNLEAKLFILSDTNDVFVPPTHSKKFVENLSEEQVSYTQIDALEHVRPGAKLKLLRAARQAGKLYIHIWQFLNFVT